MYDISSKSWHVGKTCCASKAWHIRTDNENYGKGSLRQEMSCICCLQKQTCNQLKKPIRLRSSSQLSKTGKKSAAASCCVVADAAQAAAAAQIDTSKTGARPNLLRLQRQPDIVNIVVPHVYDWQIMLSLFCVWI